jgi:hypothetical protein
MKGTAVYNWNKVIEKALQKKWQAAFDTPGHSSVSYTISSILKPRTGVIRICFMVV